MIFLKRTTILAVMCLALFAVTVSHAQERMRAGNWENTVTTANGQTMTKNACMTAENAAMANGSPAAIRAETEKALAKSGRCKLTEFNIDVNGKTETMVCGEDTIHNESKFHGQLRNHNHPDQGRRRDGSPLQRQTDGRLPR